MITLFALKIDYHTYPFLLNVAARSYHFSGFAVYRELGMTERSVSQDGVYSSVIWAVFFPGSQAAVFWHKKAANSLMQ